MSTRTTTYSLYGVNLATDFQFKNRLTSPSLDSPDLTFICQDHPPEPHDLTALEPFYAAGDRGDSPPSFAIYRLGHLDVVHVEEVADFYLYRNRIVCHLLNAEHAFMVEILFLGTVLAYWLERRGIVALHASAVTIEGQAVGFVGLNGAGKSSLAASLMGRGYPLLTDDILAVTLGPEGLVAHPGYPQMRMWPNLADFFLGDADGLERVHPEFAKLRVPVGERGFGTFQTEPAPLARLFLPQRTSEIQSSPTFERLSLRDALVWLAGVSFLAPIAEGSGMQADRLPRLRRVAESVPVFRLSYSSGMSNLAGIARAIDDHLQERGPHPKFASGGTPLNWKT